MSDKISVRDFKSMIEGMDTVLGDDWIPTADQWKKIRGRIRQLDDTQVAPTVVKQVETVASLAVARPVSPPVQTIQADAAEEALLRAFPRVPASIPSNIPVAPGPSAFSTPPSSLGPTPAQRPSINVAPPTLQPNAAALANLPPAARAAALKASAVKTPDIDSSKGYNTTYV